MSDNIPPIPEGFRIETPTAMPETAPKQPTLSLFDDTSTPTPPPIPEGFKPESEVYGTAKQTAIGLAEKFGKGLLPFGASTGIEKLFDVKPEDIEARERVLSEEHPIAGAAAEMAGLGAGLALPIGQAKVMSKAGALAADAVGLGEKAIKAGETAGYFHKLGSEAVKQAAEMAIYQAGDEAHKAILNPDVGAESAIMNIGTAAALGGAGGAAFAGVVSPLWKATLGNKVTEGLEALKSRAEGKASIRMMEGVKDAFDDLGIEAGPIAKIAMSGEGKARRSIQDLIRGQHSEVLGELASYPQQVRDAISKHIGMDLKDATYYSTKEAGDELKADFIKDIDNRYAPIKKQQDFIENEGKKISVGDDARFDFGNSLVEQGINKYGTQSSNFPIYQDYAQRVFAEDTVHGLDKVAQELRKKASGLAKDDFEKEAMHDIRQKILGFIDEQIDAKGSQLAKDSSMGRTYGQFAEAEKEIKGLTEQAIKDRAQARADYKEYVNRFDKMMDFLGIGDWKGTESLKEKLNNLSAEQLIKKFSTKGDIAGAEMLSKEFPELATKVQRHELKDFLGKAIYSDKGELILDTKTLSGMIEGLRKGSPERIEYLFPGELQNKIRSAEVIHDALTEVNRMKDSGTPGGLAKVFKHLGAGALGAIGWLAGHNPIAAGIIGEFGQRLAVNAPQEVKLALLKFMASDKPINAAGFKATVDYMQAAAKSQAKISKAVDMVVKPTTSMVASNTPDEKDRVKLQKTLDKIDKNPESLIANTAGDLSHYMEDHQQALSKSAATIAGYLKSIKPQSTQLGALDKEIPPSKEAMARYERAQNIAINPLSVLNHVKEGTLLVSDIKDLRSMYPALYNQLSQQLTDQAVNMKTSDEFIPYKTRIGISLFLAQPLDASMQPSAILAAQPKQQPQPVKAPKTANKALSELSTSYQTPTQAATADRSNRRR